MKKIVAVFVLLLFFAVSVQQCQAKELQRSKLQSITVAKMVEAAIEVFTCTTENPSVKIVEVKVVNGRKTVVAVDYNKDSNSKRP